MAGGNMVRTIVSKFKGTCRECGGFIPRGSVVRWQRGVGIWHEDCGDTRDGRAPHVSDGARVRGDGGWVTVPGSGCNCIDWPCCGHG